MDCFENVDFLAFRQAVHHLYLQSFSGMLREFGLTQMEADILLFLANNPRYDTAAELVSVRHLTKSQVSGAVARLERRGYLRREPEGRKLHLRLLEAAEPAVRRGRVCQAGFFQAVMGDLSPRERAELGRLLTRLTENAGEALRQLN